NPHSRGRPAVSAVSALASGRRNARGGRLMEGFELGVRTTFERFELCASHYPPYPPFECEGVRTRPWWAGHPFGTLRKTTRPHGTEESQHARPATPTRRPH